MIGEDIIDLDTNKSSAAKAEQQSVPSEPIILQEKKARFDFSKGVVYLSNDYHIIDKPQIIAK